VLDGLTKGSVALPVAAKPGTSQPVIWALGTLGSLYAVQDRDQVAARLAKNRSGRPAGSTTEVSPIAKRASLSPRRCRKSSC